MSIYFPVHTRNNSNLSISNLNHLPSYAAYLIKHKLNEYASYQLQLSRELKLPLLQALSHLTEEQISAIILQSANEYLSFLSENKAAEQINNSLSKWMNNQLPQIDQKDVSAEDITLVAYIRKKVFLHFINQYTNDQQVLVALIEEIDLFLLKGETEYANMYINLLRDRIQEQAYLSEKIANTSPVLIYLYDLQTDTITFVNETAERFLGISKDRLIKMGTEAHHSIVHPDDLPKTFDVFQEISQSRDKEIWSYEYRLKNEQGSYIWMCNTICIFKKNDAGFPIEIIGNVINIHSEKEVNEQLLKRKEELKISEELYKQAQALSHIGHFALHLKSNNLYLTEELKRIYDLDLTKEKFEYNDIIDLRHQEDAELVTEKIENTLKTYEPFDFEYRIITTKGVEKFVHAIGEIKFDEKGQADQLVGTIQDVSEQHKILEELQKRDHQHKQAEALTHIGSYKLNLETDKIEWSDEMYRIYGFDPATKQIIKGNDIARFTHPEDREYVRKELAESINHHKPLDFYFRILLDDGTLKILHARGEVVYNNGKPLCLVGTTQDVTEKQLLIKRLQESENLHKQAQAMAQLGNWTFDLKTQSYTWSEEMCRIYELESSKDFTVEKWADYIHPEERESVLAYLQECIATKQPYDRQHRIVLPGGKIKTLHRKGEIVLDHNGEPIKLVGTTQDITESFRIQQELKENQIFIKKIADATPSIIASYNINTGTYTFISHGIKTLLGYEAEEAKTKGVQFFIDIIHPDDIAPLIEANKEALAKANLPENQNRDEVMEFVYRMRHIAGHYLWFHTYGTVFDRNASGHVEHVLNISLDITEQHEAVQKIKEQEHFIQHIADASPTVLYVFDIKTNSIIYVNREIFFVLGYTRDEILSMSGSITSQLYHPDDIELLPERKQSPKKILESDVMHQYECRIKNKEGEWQWFLVREVVFKTDDEGKVTQIVGAALDISRRKEMEKTLLQNSFLLEQSNASLEEFAYVASHDLKEPLRKISTFGDRLADSQENTLTPEGKLYLRKIVDASQRMQLMISDLLSISMISGNKSFEPTSLEQIFKETLQTLEFKIEQKNAIIKSDNLPVTSIVPSQFRQLFQNLISNSLKFVNDDVQPIIMVSHTFLKQDEVAHYQLPASDKYLKIEFKDNGIGFEMEYAGKIFAIFQRLHGRSEYEGSGIGLAICKKIVEHHGGIIYATGVPGQGATFTIILPG